MKLKITIEIGGDEMTLRSLKSDIETYILRDGEKINKFEWEEIKSES